MPYNESWSGLAFRFDGRLPASLFLIRRIIFGDAPEYWVVHGAHSARDHRGTT